MSNLENEVLLQQNALFERIQSVLQENHQLKQELLELEAREELFREIAENVREVFFVISAQTDEILYISPAYEKIWGRSRQSLYENPHSWLMAIHIEDSRQAIATIETQFRTGEAFEEQYRIVRPDNTIRWVRVRAFPVRNVMGKVSRFVGIAEDITQRYEAEVAMRKSEEQFRLTFERSPIGMAITDLNGKFKRVNRSLCKALGYSPAELMKLSLIEIAHPEDWEFQRHLQQEVIEEKDSHLPTESESRHGNLGECDRVVETRYLTKDGRIMNALLKIVIIRDSLGKILHLNNQIVDISDRVLMEQQLLHDALHDALTGLPNRALFMDRLAQQLKKLRTSGTPTGFARSGNAHQERGENSVGKSHRRNTHRAYRHQSQDNGANHSALHPDSQEYLFAVLFIDLDRFKVVNDSAGHSIGDRLLIQIAKRLEKSVAPTDTVARLGGDEFVILLEDIRSLEDATLVARSIHRTLSFPFKIDDYELFTTASIGVALSTADYEKPEDILRDADLAMYSAKQQGKACYEVFERSLHVRACLQLQLETDLRRAIQRQELEVYYQPIACLKFGTLAGFEALARWRHPVHGYISPSDFIPLAEETGSIVPLGTWLLKEACQQFHTWQNKYPQNQNLSISINLSGKQFRQPQLVKTIDRILAETGIEGKYLKLEITESILIDNLETVTKIILELKQRQIRFSIDDFGTGYSSLSYLHRFPVDTIKIDRSFIHRMQENPENSAIVKAIVALAHILRMDVVAEGIETSTQLAQLKLLECEYGQGFFFSPPLCKADAEALIASSPRW